MSRRFSQQQLFALRNQIPIDRLIEKILAIPSKRINGYLRFACPLCQGFHTAVNAQHNLGRCFDCQKNFNPIDMVMCRNKISFKQSVDFLKNCCPQLPTTNKAHRPQLPQKSNAQLQTMPASTGEISNNAVPIGHVLAQMRLPPRAQSPIDEYLVHHQILLQRIQILEQKVNMLLKLSKIN